MIREYAIVRESAAAAADAANTAVIGWREGQIQNEETFTDRMIGAIADRFRNFHVKNVTWSAMTLTAHQPGAQEKEFGADFLGVVSVELQDLEYRKGFLAQAKLVEAGEYFSNKEFDRLKTQCKRMLRFSPASFVFLYSEEGVYVVPANAFLGLRRRHNPHVLYRRSLARFYEEHFQSFVGDPRITVASKATLADLREFDNARRALLLKATE